MNQNQTTNNRITPPRFIAFDGADGVGKSTQMLLLAETLKAKGYNVRITKALGGDGKDFVQNELRKLLLSPEFPSNDTESEERLFAISDLRNLKQNYEFLAQDQNNIVIQDRGMPSHISYCLAKGVTSANLVDYHGKLYEAYTEIAWTYGGLNIILVPEDEKLAMDRVHARGIPVVKRLENLDMQRGVITAMQKFDPTNEKAYDVLQYDTKEDFQNIVLTVTREETIEAVTSKIATALKQNGIFG